MQPRPPMKDDELIAALRRRPYDRASREAADRLEELLQQAGRQDSSSKLPTTY